MTEMTTRQVADAIGTDPKSLRKWLRDSTPRDQHPGKGGRWVLPGSKRELAAARRSFIKWQAEQADAAKDRAAKAAAAAKDAVDALDDEIETPDESDATPDES